MKTINIKKERKLVTSFTLDKNVFSDIIVYKDEKCIDFYICGENCYDITDKIINVISENANVDVKKGDWVKIKFNEDALFIETDNVLFIDICRNFPDIDIQIIDSDETNTEDIIK